MVLHVILLGIHSHSRPTRGDLLRLLRKHSQRSYHATSSYVWTEDNLFSNLIPVSLPPAVTSSLQAKKHECYGFEAHLSLGGNEEDSRVVAMILLDLTESIEGLAAVVTESECEGETDVLLLELADIIECSEDTRSRYLHRWGAKEHNYHQTMVGRVIMLGGCVFVAPLRLDEQRRRPEALPASQFSADKTTDRLGLLFVLLQMDTSERERYFEEEMTQALHVWAHRVASAMRVASWHLTVVAVPAVVADLIDRFPKLASAALLHHAVRHPLHWMRGSVLSSEEYPGVGAVIHNVVEEYRALVRSGCYVRVPLRLPRYIFAHVYCLRVPPQIEASPLYSSAVPSLNTSGGNGDEEDGAVEATEEELLIGLQLTIALQRLRQETSGPSADAVERFIKSGSLGRIGEGQGFGECDDDVFSQRCLRELRRRVMAVPTLRGHNTNWLYAYAKEAGQAQTITDNDIEQLDKYLFKDDESGASGSSDTELDEEEREQNVAPCPADYSEASVLEQLKEMELIMEGSAREVLFGGSHDKKQELTKVAANTLFLNTVQMLSFDSST